MPLILATDAPGGDAEIFASIQGEGPSMGKPCAFVRLSRCNLACHWCDTAYTWRFTGDNRPHRDDIAYDRQANQVTLEEADVAGRIAALGKERLVVTGGEPLLQAAALAVMLEILVSSRVGGSLAETGPRLRGDSLAVEIETNGTVAPTARLDALVSQYNVSPKLAHSGNPAELALIPERLEAWTAHPRAWFKFVVARPEDIEEVLDLKDRYCIPSSRIMLMAEGTDAETLAQRETWLAGLCLTHNLTLSKRLHIELFGDTRGT
ncbi:MAG TPA: 7-carboxy-7-deazaguanine synthase QueE [Sphingomonadaceae bacterium]|nr:7-carboxy-7-deazaguanine synthase QueE [Sphingomonadaceae bacterium]